MDDVSLLLILIIIGSIISGICLGQIIYPLTNLALSILVITLAGILLSILYTLHKYGVLS